MTGPLVEPDWVAARLGDPSFRVFDCTYFMPAEQRDAEAEFRLAHLPGARPFDIDRFADPAATTPHMAPTPARFAALMSDEGVSNGDTVVFYDQKGLFSAARGWWLCGLFGHDAAHVLNGGLPRWRGEDRPVERGNAPPVAQGRFTARLRTTRLRGLGDMIANLAEPRELVLDARAAARFAGTAPEPRAGLRSGHVPGSRNLPYTELLNGDGNMRDGAVLRRMFDALGADRQPVVTACGTGVTAAVISLALTQAGLPVGSLYDGSWAEWGAQPDVPVEAQP